MWNERMDYMKTVSKIAVNALIMMSELWEIEEGETKEQISELCNNYPFEKSFDEVVYEFSEWVNTWYDLI